IDRTKEQYVSVAMGGLEKGVSPLQMAAAYVPFANKGLYFKPITYTKVLTSDGELLLENEQPYEKVYSETTAFIMTDMLKGVTTAGGTAPNCVVGDGKSIPTAGKTGTTSDNIDKWFVGFTPYYVGAAWYGYDNNHEKIELSSGDERAKASQIWTAVMNKIHEGLGEADFDIPSGLVERNICIYSGKIATDLCKLDPRGSAVRTEYFISGTEPSFSDQCTSHVKVRVCTACKDAWGRYLLAGSDCPASTIAEKILVSRLIPYYPKFPNEPYPQDWSYEAPVSEYCTVH
ncbi:MAG: penicillin-binding transpeptidase domain-containing protein, partial [Eubacteriales bacterium]|nr:penicillin-binding transpeptidase domain-containing protein [Eubacteriales bacterium]